MRSLGGNPATTTRETLVCVPFRSENMSQYDTCSESSESLGGGAAPSVRKPEGSHHHRGPLDICLLVEPSPITYVGGQSVRIRTLIQHLIDNNNNNNNTTSDDDDDDDDYYHVELITAEVVDPEPPDQWRGVPVHHTHGFRLPHYPTLTISFDWTFQVLRLVAQQRPDILHVTTPGLFMFGALLCSRIFQIPLVMSYHTHLPVYVRTYLPSYLSPLAEWCLWLLNRLVHACADLVVVTSPQIRDEFHQHGIFGINNSLVQVWPKGVDTRQFHPRHYSAPMRHRMSGGGGGGGGGGDATNNNALDFLIVSIGRLGSEKRLKDLRDILKGVPGGRLCIVGTGPQEPELREYFQGTPTVFLGQLTGLELSQAFASGDAFCLPSDSETLGFVVLESMASGVPCVGANAGGVPHIIRDGVKGTGFLVPPGDTDAFAEKLRLLQKDQKLRAAMSVAARRETERWSWEASMDKLVNELYPKAQMNFNDRFERRLWRALCSYFHG